MERKHCADIDPFTFICTINDTQISFFLPYSHTKPLSLSIRILCDQWQLRVAEHKCLVLSHGNCDPPSYYLKDVNLDNVDHHKDLGVIVDGHCLFKQHMFYICKKAYCSTNVLFRCFHTANTVALIRCYKSFIRPVLEYCSTVWNPYTC